MTGSSTEAVKTLLHPADTLLKRGDKFEDNDL
jgi:hypothetical protein